MTKLRLAALAACAALIPSMAAAEEQGAGHTWREGAPPPVVRPAPPPVVRHAPQEMRREVRREMHRGERHMRGGTRHFVHRRIDRGGFVPNFWWGPQFVVPSWQMYGFPQPFAGGRWIRYYDDALLIDRDGRVHDGRYGWDWSRDRDRWREDGNGVPVYVGDGDFEPQEWDYEWAERWEDGERPDDYAHGGYDYEPLPGYEDCGNPCVRTYHGAPPPLPDMRGYCCGPVIITETVTTTGPVYEKRVYHDYVKEAPRRVYKRKAIRRPAPPRPGERG